MTARIRLVRLPEDEPRDVSDAVFDGLEGLSRTASREALGSEDLTTSSPEFRHLVSDADARRGRVVAIADQGGAGIDAVGDLDAAQVVGTVSVVAPLTSDTHTGEIDVQIAGGWDASGLRDQLLDVGEALAVAWHRSTLHLWSACPQWAEAGSPRTVVGMATPVPGTGEVVAPVRTPMTDLLQARGYRPVHAEWVTCLDIEDSRQSADASGRPAEVPGHEILSWGGPRSPEQLLDQLAALYALAATDMPSGQMTIEPGAWDADRVLRKEALAQRCGQEWVTTAVRPIGGELVGWTTLMIAPGLPEVVYQEGTLVRGDRRGQGLAGWMKRVNLAELRARHPRARRVYTWTEGDNAPVIAMNARLGFRPVAIDVCVEKTVGAAPEAAR